METAERIIETIIVGTVLIYITNKWADNKSAIDMAEKNFISFMKKFFDFTMSYLLPIAGLIFFITTTKEVTKFFVINCILLINAVIINVIFTVLKSLRK